MYARIEDGNIVEWPIINIHQRFPNISFPETITEKCLPEGVVVVEYDSYPTFDSKKEVVELSDKPEFKDNKWKLQYKVRNLTEEEIEKTLKSKADSIRMQRNSLLAQTDWTQAKDISDEVSLKWVDYRQALRDITNQEGFPENVVFPEQP